MIDQNLTRYITIEPTLKKVIAREWITFLLVTLLGVILFVYSQFVVVPPETFQVKLTPAQRLEAKNMGIVHWGNATLQFYKGEEPPEINTFKNMSHDNVEMTKNIFGQGGMILMFFGYLLCAFIRFTAWCVRTIKGS